MFSVRDLDISKVEMQSHQGPKPHLGIEIVCHIGGRNMIKVLVIFKEFLGKTMVGISKPFCQ